MSGRIRGEQIRDESIDSADLMSGSIKAGEVDEQVISGQPVLGSADTTNDRLLIWDANGSPTGSLKQIAPANLGVSASPAGSDTQVQYNNGGSLGGASRLIWDDNNYRLGIGSTDAPDYTLDVAGNIGVDQYIYHNGDADTYIRFQNNDVRIAAMGVETLTISGSAVGIGVRDPQSPLHVYDEIVGSYVVTIDNDEGAQGHGLKVTSDGNGSSTYLFDLESGSTTLFRVRGDGRVGIGKVSSLPAAMLTVSSSNDDSDIAIAHKIHHIGDSDTFIMFDDDELHLAAGGRTFLKLEEASTDKLIVNHGALDIDLQVKGANAANLIRTDAEIDTVGINTNSPKSTLSVAGSLALNVTKIDSANDPGTSYSIVATDCVILINTRPTAQGGIDSAITVTLPDASNFPGRVITIKDAAGYSDVNGITINAYSGDNFEGNPSTTSLSLSSPASFKTLISDGLSSWFEIGS